MMAMTPLSDLAHRKLREASEDARGAKLANRHEKKAADELAARGYVKINRSRTRAIIRPAGAFVLRKQ